MNSATKGLAVFHTAGPVAILKESMEFMKRFKENVYEGRILCCRAGINFGGCTHLPVSVCKQHSAERKIGLFDFAAGQNWAPQDNPAFAGILPMILGSIYITAGAIIIGVPIGILAIFMARFCPKGLYRILRGSGAAGGHSFGCIWFWSDVVLVPFVRETFSLRGTSILTPQFCPVL